VLSITRPSRRRGDRSDARQESFGTHLGEVRRIRLPCVVGGSVRHRRLHHADGTAADARRAAPRVLAVEMLARHEPITTIAIELGHHGVSAFIALFKRTFGVTPSHYVDSR